MAELVVVTRNGEEKRLPITSGMNLMETIRNAGIDELLALCGGSCSCATCHVHIDSAFADKLLPMSEDENDLLDTSEHRDATSRLSCQIELNDQLDGLRATIAAED